MTEIIKHFLDGSDYNGIDTTLLFPAGSKNGTTACINIPIIHNDSFEKDEVFSLHITEVEDNVIIDHRYTVVHIIDVGCK